MSRRKLLNAGRKKKVDEVEKKIHAFLKKPENATEVPTKRDPGRMSLNNTLRNLHAKFLEKHPGIQMSFALFAKNKPGNIKTVKYTARRQCLCIKCVNGQLKCEVIREDEQLYIHCFLVICGRNTGHEWKLTDIQSKNSIIKRTPLQVKAMDKEDFVIVFKYNLTQLQEHIEECAINSNRWTF